MKSDTPANGKSVWGYMQEVSHVANNKMTALHKLQIFRRVQEEE